MNGAESGRSASLVFTNGVRHGGHEIGGLTSHRIAAPDSREWLADTSLSTKQAEATERVRFQVFIVNRRTRWCCELILALLGHTRAWLFRKELTSLVRLEHPSCYVLGPALLVQEWHRLLERKGNGDGI